MSRLNQVPESQAERLTIIVLNALMDFWLKSVPESRPRLMYKSESAARMRAQGRSRHEKPKPSAHAKAMLTTL